MMQYVDHALVCVWPIPYFGQFLAPWTILVTYSSLSWAEIKLHWRWVAWKIYWETRWRRILPGSSLWLILESRNRSPQLTNCLSASHTSQHMLTWLLLWQSHLHQHLWKTSHRFSPSHPIVSGCLQSLTREREGLYSTSSSRQPSTDSEDASQLAYEFYSSIFSNAFDQQLAYLTSFNLFPAQASKKVSFWRQRTLTRMHSSLSYMHTHALNSALNTYLWSCHISVAKPFPWVWVGGTLCNHRQRRRQKKCCFISKW